MIEGNRYVSREGANGKTRKRSRFDRLGGEGSGVQQAGEAEGQGKEREAVSGRDGCQHPRTPRRELERDVGRRQSGMAVMLAERSEVTIGEHASSIEGERARLGEDFQIGSVLCQLPVGSGAFEFGEVQGVGDPEDSGVRSIDEAEGRDGGLEHVAIVGIVQRNHTGGGMAAGENIDSCDGDVHLLEGSSQAELGDADTGGVAMRAG